MDLPPLDFAIVVHDEKVDPSGILDILETMNIAPLSVITFSDWVEHTHNPEFNILCIYDYGEVIFARSALDKARVRKQIELQKKRGTR